MSIIKVEKFGGIIPKLGDAALPPGAAMYANNVDVVGGVIRPLAAGGKISPSLGTGWAGELSGADVNNTGITAPSAPTASDGTPKYICRPIDGAWLSITYRVWALFTPDDGTPQQWTWIGGYVGDSGTASDPYTGLTVKNTEQGLTVSGAMSPVDNSFYLYNKTGVVKVLGPKYRFRLLANPSWGGPEEFTDSNPTPQYGDPEIPIQKTPLAFNNGDGNRIIYGAFEVVDVDGPKWDEEYSIQIAVPPQNFYFPWNGNFPNVSFNINLNYAEPRRRYFYYVSANTRDDGEVEGPPSDVSREIQLKPGQFVTLTTGITSTGKLYRSNTGGDDFGLLDGDCGPSFQDWGRGVSNIPIPPYGNFPGGTASAQAANTLLHPASFGVYWNDNTLYLSDRYRLHAWPGDYTVPFPEPIIGCVLSGNTIIVFTTSRVYGVSGSNPDNMQRILLSDDKPAANMGNVCRINQTIYWTTAQGLCACSGGDVKVITETHYMGTSDFPGNGPIKVADGIIYTGGLRIELDEDVIRSISTIDDAYVGENTPTATAGALYGLIGRSL